MRAGAGSSSDEEGREDEEQEHVLSLRGDERDVVGDRVGGDDRDHGDDQRHADALPEEVEEGRPVEEVLPGVEGEPLRPREGEDVDAVQE